METFLSVIGLAVFLVVAYGIGLFLTRFKNARFHKTWVPLQPLIDGKVVDDGGGAASSWLTGTYQGHKVHARMSPERNLYSGESGGPRYNDFAVSIENVQGAHDWTFEFDAPVWRVKADTTAVAQRLERAGIQEHLPGLGFPKVTYRRSSKLIEYQVDITPSLVPSPELFLRTLDFLVWLEGVNREANRD